MRIALITDAWQPQINGVVTTLGHVKKELEQLGHEMLVIHPTLFRTFKCPKYPEIRLSLLPGRGVRRMLEDYQPQAVHIATEGPLGLSARRYCRRMGIGFTTSYHTQFPIYVKKYFGVPERWTYALTRGFHNAAQRTLAPTPSVRDELEQRGFRNVKVWTRGVDTTLFKPRNKDFLLEKRPIFLYAGRVALEKNIESFLRADLPGTKVVVGDGPETLSLIKKFPQARFLGFKHGIELASHFAAADVFVFPSRTDTFGVVMLEAMACGVPVAAYPVTGPIDVVKHGVTGILDEDLGHAARLAAELDPSPCRPYAQQFSWLRCAEMFFDNLERIEWPSAHEDQVDAPRLEANQL